MSMLDPVDPEESGTPDANELENANAGAGSGSTLVLRRPCPACGAPLSKDVLARVLSCSFCRRSHFMTGERTHLTAFLEPRIAPEAALLAVKRALRERMVRATEVNEPRLLFVPYWRLQTRLFT